jgi:DNA-binding NtrC family response regulator
VAASVLFHRPADPVQPAPPPPQPDLSAPEAHAVGRVPSSGHTPWTSGPFALDDHLREAESRLIASALIESRGNKSLAARLLGVKRSTLGDRIARCGLP